MASPERLGVIGAMPQNIVTDGALANGVVHFVTDPSTRESQQPAGVLSVVPLLFGSGLAGGMCLAVEDFGGAFLVRVPCPAQLSAAESFA